MRYVIDAAYVLAWTMFGMWVAEQAARNDFPREVLPETINWHLGAEYNEIAKAIFTGRGFADPFRVESGPTAWMPPALPYILAGLYWLTDFHPPSVIEFVLALKALVIVLTGIIVLSESRRLGLLWMGRLMIPVAMLANFRDLFQITHDLWLNLLCVDLMWLGLNYFWRPTSLWRSVAWGVFGGLAALCSPVIGLSWAVATVVFSGVLTRVRARLGRYIQSNSRSCCKVDVGSATSDSALRGVVLAGVCSILVVTPWTVRNYQLFGRLIPIKSNAPFELWQSQCLDDDGVLNQSLTRKHPFVSSGREQRELYLRLGEPEFLRKKQQEGWRCVLRDKLGYARRVGNRFLAAFLWYYSYYDEPPYREWWLTIKRCVFPWAIFSVAIVLMLRKAHDRQFTSAVFIYFLHLFPYVLISYGDRYAAPLIGIKCILILHGMAVLKSVSERYQLDAWSLRGLRA